MFSEDGYAAPLKMLQSSNENWKLLTDIKAKWQQNIFSQRVSYSMKISLNLLIGFACILQNLKDRALLRGDV